MNNPRFDEIVKEFREKEDELLSWKGKEYESSGYPKGLRMKFLDLFSGIGGFALGLERAGMQVIAFCEIDSFCQKVLRKHWSDVPIYDDVRKLTKAKLVEDEVIEADETVDLICAGFPCQPFSLAGKRRGTKDDRYLWPEMLRVVSEVRPRWVIAENVYGFVTLQGGVAFERACADLENEDYEVQAFVIPACAVGAPHRRDRVWIIAHSKCLGWKERTRQGVQPQKQKAERQDAHYSDSEGVTAYTDGQGLQGCGRYEESSREIAVATSAWQKSWFEAAARLCRMVNGIPNRVDRLKALGNAVVPQLVEVIGRAIMEVERIEGVVAGWSGMRTCASWATATTAQDALRKSQASADG